MKTILFILMAIGSGTLSVAQYAPQAGVPGSDAISASSSVFTGWATQCFTKRGFLNIDSPALGNVTTGDSSFALGAVDHYILSMGDSGVATLGFASALYDGPGADFAVFENGFINVANDSQAFMELAFVEVSSDGSRFVRFPATSLTQINTQVPGAGVYMYANMVNNLAGKYISNYGTPFDLHELADSPGLDVTNITQVRIVDVIGSVSNHQSTDIAGHIINDPYPTQFATGGFDLDAVGAIHQKTIDHSAVTTLAGLITVTAYPNPATDKITICVKGDVPTGLTATLTAITGQQLMHIMVMQNMCKLDVEQLPAGMYYLTLSDANGNKWVDKVTKR